MGYQEPMLRRLVFMAIKELAESETDAIIVTNCLMKVLLPTRLQLRGSIRTRQPQRQETDRVQTDVPSF